MENMTASSGSGPPGNSVVAHLRGVFTPRQRTRSWMKDTDTMGDVLDTSRSPCESWQRWYSRDRQEVGVMKKPCGRKTCPTCAADWLIKRVGPAYTRWGGRAQRATFDNERDWFNERRASGVRMYGKNVTPGVVSIPAPDGSVIVWAPVTAGLSTGAVLSGRALDEALREDVRAMEIAAYKPKGGGREPSDAFGFAPGETRIEHAARVAGFELRVSGGRRRALAGGITEEQNAAFVRALRAK